MKELSLNECSEVNGGEISAGGVAVAGLGGFSTGAGIGMKIGSIGGGFGIVTGGLIGGMLGTVSGVYTYISLK